MNSHSYFCRPPKRLFGSSLRSLTLATLASGGTLLCSAQVADDWFKYLRLGAVSAMNLRAEFSMSGTAPPASLGNLPGGGMRYDDGYVGSDATGNAGGLTSYWGYDNASQIQGVGNAQTLQYHDTKSIASASSSFGSSREDNGVDFGLDVGYGGVLTLWKKTLIGWELGFTYLPVSFQDNRAFATKIKRSTFSYGAPQTIVPGFPYSGGSSGIGPLISSTGTELPGLSEVDGSLTGKRELDTTLYNLKLGPTFYWDLSRRIALQAGAGGAVGLLKGNYSFQEVSRANGETLTRSLKGGFGSTDLVYGGYAGVNLLWHTAEKADIFVGAQYLRLGSVTYSQAGRQAKVEFNNGIYLTAGINWPF
jgi:hypothetical protein